MADPGFPGRHTTQTTVTQTAVAPSIRFDVTYVKTIPGILKCACIFLNFVGFICIQCSGPYQYLSRGSFFSSISMSAFWYTGILLAFYLFHICEKFYQIPWLKIELLGGVIWVILYLFAASFAASVHVEAFSAAAFFGFSAMCLYGFDAFLKYRGVRNGEIAQGSRVVSKQMSTVVQQA